MDTGLLMFSTFLLGVVLAIYGHQRTKRFSEQIFHDIRYLGLWLITIGVTMSFLQVKGFIA